MIPDDFGKIWRLFQTLFPASPRVKSKDERIVWEVALQPYALDDVTAAVMSWARKSKFFPDISDITGGLTAVDVPPEKPPKRGGYGDTAWMLPYIRKNICLQTDADAEEIHAVGLLTWGEAEAAGMDFREWNRAYREKFPVGGGP